MNNSLATAVLCGDLNMLRCFAGTKIPTLLVSSDPHSLIFYSRYCRYKKVIANPLSDPDQVVDDLVDVARTFSERPVLFYGDDAMLLLISRNRERLAEYYHFLLPEQELLEDLVDKPRFYQLAMRLGFPIPKTILSRSIKTVDDVCRNLSFPCILKPNTHIGWFESQVVREAGTGPQKVLRANNFSELNDLYGKIKKFTRDFLIQEYIFGSDHEIYSLHAYLNQQSEPLAYYVGRKIRTYPKDSGLSTYLELVKEPEVVRIGLEILKQVRFVGQVKIDFKKDKSTNQYFLLEINPRFNLWNYLGAACGVNLPLVAYKDLLGQAYQSQKDYKIGIRWLSFGNDLRTFIRGYHPAGDLSWAEWLFSLKGRKIYDLFSWRDPVPFMINIFRHSINVFRHPISLFKKIAGHRS